MTDDSWLGLLILAVGVWAISIIFIPTEET